MQELPGWKDAGSKFGHADWAIFIIMLVVSVLIGVYSAVKNGRRVTINDYLLGGRNMPPLAVVFSLLGGWVSAISILGNATETYFYGTQVTTTLFGVIPATIAMHSFVIPILYDLKLYSVCEYLELRFQSAALRKVGSLIILTQSSCYMGMFLYSPSLALVTVTNLSIFASMAIMSAIVTFYITIGGVKAVVYTDVLQTLLMFGGVLAAVVLCVIDLGGVGEVWATAGRGGRLEFFNLDTSPYVRHTLWSTVCLGFFIGINEIAFSQITYQRFASVSSVNTARRLPWAFLAGLWCLWTVFFFSGLVAYATYNTCDPLTSGKVTKPDQIIPFLVMDKLGHIPGLTGIFVAAVYGGVLSSVSSTGNSMACMVWQDFLKPRPFFSGLSDSSVMVIIKTLSSLTGVVALGLGVFVSKLGNIFQVSKAVGSAVAGPLSGVFLAGMLLPWVNAKGAFAGLLVSSSFGVWLAVGQLLKEGGRFPTLPLSVDSCPAQINTTIESIASTNLVTDTAITGIFDRAEEDIYDLSYCYRGVIAFSITMVVSSVVSLMTGLIPPKDTKAEVVNATCARLYALLWQRWCDERKKDTDMMQHIQDEEDDVLMTVVSATKKDLQKTEL